MNQLAQYKIFLGAALAAGVSFCGYMGYTEAAHNITMIGSALLAALGLNAIGQGNQTGAPAKVTNLSVVGK